MRYLLRSQTRFYTSYFYASYSYFYTSYSYLVLIQVQALHTELASATRSGDKAYSELQAARQQVRLAAKWRNNRTVTVAEDKTLEPNSM